MAIIRMIDTEHDDFRRITEVGDCLWRETEAQKMQRRRLAVFCGSLNVMFRSGRNKNPAHLQGNGVFNSAKTRQLK